MQTIFAQIGMVVLTAALTSANAAEPRKNERYCLESPEEEGFSSPQCMFETLEQCGASKTTQGDRCMLNPILAFREREKTSTSWRTRP
jgi:hypothetical protein